MAIINSNQNSDQSNGTLSSSPSHSPVIVDGDDPSHSPGPSPPVNGHGSNSSFGIARILKNDIPKVAISSSGHIHLPSAVNASLSFGIARLLRNDPPKTSTMADYMPTVSNTTLIRPSYQLPFTNFTHPFLRFGPSFSAQARDELSRKFELINS